MGNTFRPVDVVREYCSKFPTAPSKTLARRIIKDHPRLYANLDCCYYAVQRVFGVAGERSRKSKSTEAKALRRPKRSAGWKFPEGLSHHKDWGPAVVAGSQICLVLSDVHAPWHNLKALTASVQYGKDEKANLVVLNGDIWDCYIGSKYQTDPRKRDIMNERNVVCDILSNIRRAFPRARIIFKQGNHEERWYKWICGANPDLLHLPELSLESFLRLKDFKIEAVPDRRQIQVGDYSIIHGHEHGGMFGHSVSPARTYWGKTLCNTIVGHTHRITTHSAIGMGRVDTVHSTGCLSDIYPDWMPHNMWEHGFATLHVAKSGKTAANNIRNSDL